MSGIDPSIRIANAPCSWGVVSGAEGRPPGWRQVLDEIAATGYAGTELGDWGFMPDDGALLRSELASRGLTMVGAFTPVMLSDESCRAAAEARALRTARLLAECVRDTPGEGGPFVILADDPGPSSHRIRNAGRIRAEHSLNDDAGRALAAGAQRLAAAIRDETGLRTVFHHHCGTFVETPEETERLLAMTSADLLGLCVDTGHYVYAGGDPVDLVRRHADRVWLVHFKDCDAAMTARSRAEGWDYIAAIRNGIFCGLGEGAVDHPRILDELRRAGYHGWVVVESEAPPGRVPPLLMAQRDREYLAGLGL